SEAIAADSSFSSVKTKIEVLGNGEKYIDAFQEHTKATAKYKTRLKELEEIRLVLKEKQVATLKRYEELLAQRLNDVVLIDPATRGETIVPMIKPALVPESVTDQPGPTFLWATKFMALWEKEADTVKKAASLPGEKVIATADAFDEAGLEALKLDLPSGFRAARHPAQTTRVGQLREIAAGSDDVIDTKTAGAVTGSSTAASKKGADAAAGLEKDQKDTLLNDLATQDRQVNDLAKNIKD